MSKYAHNNNREGVMGCDLGQLNELNEIIKSKDEFIALQSRDMDALKREIKQLKHELGRARTRKK